MTLYMRRMFLYIEDYISLPHEVLVIIDGKGFKILILKEILIGCCYNKRSEKKSVE